jgi:hypothetical protein
MAARPIIGIMAEPAILASQLKSGHFVEDCLLNAWSAHEPLSGHDLSHQVVAA